MIDKTEIIKMAKHVFKRSAGIPDKRIMHPRREWAIGLLIFVVILVSGSAYTASSFNRFRELDTNNGEANVTIPRYQASLVSAVLSDYEARTKAYEELTNEIPVIINTEVSTSTASTSVEVSSEVASSTNSGITTEEEIDPATAAGDSE